MNRSAPMRRTPMARSRPAAPAPRDRKVTLPAPRPADAPRGAYCRVLPTAHPVPPRIADRVDNRIRQSARNEECTVRIPGCPGLPEQTIWSHAPLGAAGKGRGLKAIDLCGAYCCTYCDAVIDGQRPLPAGYTRPMAMLDWFMGHMRSLVKLKQKGLA